MMSHKITVQKLLFSPTMNRLGLFLGETLSPKMGNWIISLVTNQISRRKENEQVKAVRVNQWVVRGKTSNRKELDEIVKKVYQSSGRALYDYYHCMRNETRIRELIQFDDNLNYFIRRIRDEKKRTLGLVLHMGAFDLSGFAIAISGAKPFILSYPNPNPAYKWQNELRRQSGLIVEPLSMESFHLAAKYLRQGGAVITGVDRPWAATTYHPKFFGMPCDIPVTTIQMAIRTETPIMLLACIRQPDERYILHASELIETRRYNDREEELIENTGKVLSAAEPFIASAPDQWAMFYPVWPDISV